MGLYCSVQPALPPSRSDLTITEHPLYLFYRYARECITAQSHNCKFSLCAYMFMVVIYAIENQFYSCKTT